MDAMLTIGQAAKATGLNAKTIRYYEDAGVVRPAARSDSGYRLYTGLDVRKLKLARRARLLGMSVAESRELVHSAFAGACGDYAKNVAAIARRRSAEVEAAISELGALRDELARVLAEAEHARQVASPGIRVADCPCCLLIDDSRMGQCCADEARPGFRPEDIEVMDILACSISRRPAGAPGPDELRPLLRAATVDGGLATLEFAPEAASIVADFAAAERLCCDGIGWDVDSATLRVRGTPAQMEAFSRWWREPQAPA